MPVGAGHVAVGRVHPGVARPANVAIDTVLRGPFQDQGRVRDHHVDDGRARDVDSSLRVRGDAAHVGHRGVGEGRQRVAAEQSEFAHAPVGGEVGHLQAPSVRRLAAPVRRVGAGQAGVALVEHEHLPAPGGERHGIEQRGEADARDRIGPRERNGTYFAARRHADARAPVEEEELRAGALGEQDVLDAVLPGPGGEHLVALVARDQAVAAILGGQLEAAAASLEQRRRGEPWQERAAHQKVNPSESRLMGPRNPPSVKA